MSPDVVIRPVVRNLKPAAPPSSSSSIQAAAREAAERQAEAAERAYPKLEPGGAARREAEEEEEEDETAEVASAGRAGGFEQVLRQPVVPYSYHQMARTQPQTLVSHMSFSV